MTPRKRVVLLVVLVNCVCLGDNVELGNCKPDQPDKCMEIETSTRVVDPEPGKHICLPTVIPMTTEGITLHPYDKFFVNITNFLGTVSLSFSGYNRFLNQSCVCEEVGGRFIVVDTGELLHNDVPSNLTDVYLNITIEASEFSAKYFPPGLHLINGDTFNVSDLPLPVARFVLVLVNKEILQPSSLKVCEKNDGGTPYTESDNFEVTLIQVGTGAVLTCATFPSLLKKNFFFEVRLKAKVAITELVKSSYELVVSTQECSMLNSENESRQPFTSDVFTINVPPDIDPTMTPTSSPGTTTATRDPGGLAGGKIAAVVISLLFAVGILVAVIPAIFMYRKLKEHIRRKRDTHAAPAPAPGDVEMQADHHAQVQRAQQLVVAPEPDGRTVYVYDVAQFDSDDKITKMLALQEERAALKNIEEHIENGLLYAIVRRQHCVRLYIIFRESIEWLKDNHHLLWKVVRDFQTRPLPANLLNKVVLIRVYEEHNDTILEIVESSILTVNIHKEKWRREPEECVRLIRSKVRIDAGIYDNPDGGSVKDSPSGTPPSDSHLPVPDIPPPDYSTPLLSEPMPAAKPPVAVVDGNKVLAEAVNTLAEEFKGLKEATLAVADNTRRTADNTEGLGETVEEVRGTTISISDAVLDERVSAEASYD